MIVNFSTFTDADLVQSFIYQTSLGAAINLGTSSLRFQARADPADPTVWIECTTLNGNIVVTNPTAGAFTLTIPVALLSKMPNGIYYHSLIITDPITLLRTNVWRGTITHAAGPTRWTLGTL